MTLLAALQAVRAFAPGLPFGEQLAAVHIPFDDLTGHPGYETKVRKMAAAGGMVLVVGDTGRGKSGLVSYALSIHADFLPVPVPVSVPNPEGAAAAEVPRLVLGGLANALSLVDEAATAQAQRVAAGQRGRVSGGAVDLKFVKVELEGILHTRHYTAAEVRDAVHQALASCSEGGLTPVLVLDDTDKWAGSEARLAHGRAFFDDAVRALVDLEAPVVANAHPRYFPAGHRPEHFDGCVDMPHVDAAGVFRILAHRIHVATDGHAQLEDILDHNALKRLGQWYAAENPSLRRVVQVASEALVEADEAGCERVTIGAVENVITLP